MLAQRKAAVDRLTTPNNFKALLKAKYDAAEHEKIESTRVVKVSATLCSNPKNRSRMGLQVKHMSADEVTSTFERLASSKARAAPTAATSPLTVIDPCGACRWSTSSTTTRRLRVPRRQWTTQHRSRCWSAS